MNRPRGEVLLANIEDRRGDVLKVCGEQPNVVLLGEEEWLAIRMLGSPSVIVSLEGSSESIAAEAIPRIHGIRVVLVAKASYFGVAFVPRAPS